jgi:MFS superfamily sulfate permease-like transporter
MVLMPRAGGHWEPETARAGIETAPGLIVYRFGADLFYANADNFVDQVRELIAKAPTPVKWLLIDAEAIVAIDLSAAQTVRVLVEDLSHRGVRVLIGRVSPFLLSDMRRHRIAELIGEESIFPTLHQALDVVRAEGGELDPEGKSPH